MVKIEKLITYVIKIPTPKIEQIQKIGKFNENLRENTYPLNIYYVNIYNLLKTFDEFKTILTTMQVITDYVNKLFQICRTQFASKYCNAISMQIFRQQFVTESIK